MVTPTSMLKSLAALVALAVAVTGPVMGQKKDPGQDYIRGEAFEMKGVHVILYPSDNEIVSVIMGVEGGFASGETQNPALTEFTADVVTSSGSTSFPKEKMRRFLAQTSTTITGSGDYRGMSFSMTTPRSTFMRSWDIMASMITDPAFDSVEFRNIREQRIAEAKRRWSNPESQASIIADSLVKLGNPTLGRYITQADVEKVTIPMMQKLMKQGAERSRILVVVVGKVTREEVEKKLQVFTALSGGSYKRPKIQALKAARKPVVEVADRSGSPTTYVYGSFAGPPASDADFWPLQIGLRHLRGILFEEVRTKRNLSYAPGSGLSSTLGQSHGSISVSSVLPDSAITVMLHELEKMRTGQIDEEELNNSKQVFLTSYYMRQMTNSGIANAIYSAQRNAGDWRHAFSLDAIAQVNKASVQRAFNKYAKNLQFGIVGNRSKVTTDKYVFR